MPGEPIDSKIVNDAVDRLFSIDKFQRVDAFTTQEKGEKVLQVVVEDKSWGPNFLQFGLVHQDQKHEILYKDRLLLNYLTECIYFPLCQ